MERKIGEIFEYNGEWYQCVECDKCKNCDLLDKQINPYLCHSIFRCLSKFREDKKQVVFKKLEKVGEPYEYFVQHRGIVMLQPYKLFTTSIINGVICNVNYDTNTIDLEIKQNKEDMEEQHSAENYPTKEEKIAERIANKVSKDIQNQLDKNMNKLKLKPFSLEAAKQGKPVCTRDGRKARIIAFDSKHDSQRPIIALITDNNRELLYEYTIDGKDDFARRNYTGTSDLMMLPEKKEGWVNIYRDYNEIETGISVYNTEKEAKKGIENNSNLLSYLDTIKITWEE